MITYWIFFNIAIFILLLADLFFFHPKDKVISLKESLLWSGFWIALALVFNIFIYFAYGKTQAMDFFAGYLIEKTLSIDNIFVFFLIFQSFKTPPQYFHKILFWGILGAIILRGLFIIIGITVIEAFHQILYILGLFLIYSGAKLFFNKDRKIEFRKSIFFKLIYRFIPITHDYENGYFFIKKNRRSYATPLLLTLLAIEFTDVIFALDSIPAIFAITLDPFIVYTSNIFAILGLRSLYFVLANLISYFRYLHYAIALLLMLAGLKMLLRNFVDLSTLFTLGMIFFILFIAIILSILFPKKSI